MIENRDERVYRVGELAKLCGLPTSTLRLWNKQGFIGVRKTEGGHRLFNDRDLKWVLQARDLTQGRYMTSELASTINSLVEASEQPVKLAEPTPLRSLRHDRNYERMLDLASQNARLFAEQRDLAGKLAELASDLAATQEAYSSAVERIAECLWSAEVQASNWAFRLCTPAILSITGYPPDAFFSDPEQWVKMVHTEDRARVDRALSKVAHGEGMDVEYRILRANGEIRWVRSTLRPTTEASGRVFRVDGMLADVTERKLAEFSLRASEQKLRVAIASFPDTIFTQDRDLRYTSAVNLQGGRPGEAFLGLTPWDIHPPEEASLIQRMSESVLNTGQTAREVLKLTIRGEPTYRDTVISPLFGADGTIEGLITYSRDVTERTRIDQGLRASLDALRRTLEGSRESESFYRTISEQSPVGTLVINREGYIIYANHTLVELLGYDAADLTGKPLADLIVHTAPKDIETLVDNCLHSRGNLTHLTLKASSAKEIVFAFRANPLQDLKESITHRATLVLWPEPDLPLEVH